MIVDNLVLEKCIGKGDFSEVYLTTKKGSDKKFAAKKKKRELFESPNVKKYLKNEITILQNLNHPNIIKFEDIKKTKKNYYIITEFCNGGELSKALEEYQEKYNKPFSEEIVQHLMRQIIDAFKYIHGFKIIHRDINLDNILLHFDDEKDKENLNMMKAKIKIIDFGFSSKLNKNGLVYSTVGCPITMSPILLKKLNSDDEKASKLGYDIKADIWSLGAIFYEMLIGKCIFDAEDMEELVKKVEDGEYTIPTSLSKEVASFLNGMLQYNPDLRLDCEKLSKHIFLTGNIKDFHPINTKKTYKKLSTKGSKGLRNSIWPIFDDKEEINHNKISLNKSSIFDFDDKNFNGNMLPSPSQGIPGSPINQNFQELKPDQSDS